MARVIDMNMTRIEGHMEIETDVSGGSVREARVKGKMFRGFEYLLKGRHPVDALRITQRVCGVCHEVHGTASALALAELYGVQPPPNGNLLRDMILGLHLVTDHLLHFYTLSIPDYIDFSQVLKYSGRDPQVRKIRDWVAQKGAGFIEGRAGGDYLRDMDLCLRMAGNYAETLQVRAQGGKGIALLGAKAPFCHALMPGGITTRITPDRLINYRAILEQVQEFVQTAYVPDMLSLASNFRRYFEIGRSRHNFFSNQSFACLGEPLFRAGVIVDGVRENFNPELVSEEIASSWYSGDLNPDPGKSGAYSWSRSPRYRGKPMEVGPLARMMVLREPGFLSYMTRFGATPQSSVMARMVARAAESELICRHLFDLLERFDPDGPTIIDFDMSRPVTGSGRGYSIAARGALIHSIEAVNGRIEKYDMIVPSTWNFGPRTPSDRGVVEQALIGTPVEFGEENPIEVGRVVRSYDPCTACSIH